MGCIFITGSADGLGRAAARSLMEEGHQVVLHARWRERASAFVDLALRSVSVVIGDLSLIEVNGLGGFFCESARTLVLGKASAELLEGFAAVKAVQDHTLSRLKPGAKARDVAAARDDYMIGPGLPPEIRLYAHSQVRHGRAAAHPSRRDMTIAVGMRLAVHPGYKTDSVFAVIRDNYLIGADGPGPCLHRTEKRIFEL